MHSCLGELTSHLACCNNFPPTWTTLGRILQHQNIGRFLSVAISKKPKLVALHSSECAVITLGYCGGFYFSKRKRFYPYIFSFVDTSLVARRVNQFFFSNELSLSLAVYIPAIILGVLTVSFFCYAPLRYLSC